MPRRANATSDNSQVSTRKRTRSLKQSQSAQDDSQASTASLQHINPEAPSQPVAETFGTTISSATLPSFSTNSYRITLALPQDVELTASAAQEAYVRGEEILSDGWRRDVHLEGRQSDRHALLKKQRGSVRFSASQAVNQPDDSGLTVRDKTFAKGETLWYTAGLSYPCVCSLRRLKYAYTPANLPPTISALDALAFPSIPSRTPQVGSGLLAWSDTLESDLDSCLDEIEDFDPLWHVANQSTSVKQKDIHMPEDPEASQDSEATVPVQDDQQALKRRLRKGKYRATEILDVSLDTLGSPPMADAPITTDVSVQDGPVNTVSLQAFVPRSRNSGNEEWEEEAKRRKKWWRSEIRGDRSYGAIWTFLPPPYSYPVRYFPRQRKRRKKTSSVVPDYKLFRNYLTSSHPFHPDLPAYISTHPSARVYWLVPLHGPVLIPTLNHPLDTPSTTFKGIPSPSRATLLSAETYSTTNLDGKPVNVFWTRELILTFLRTFLHPLYMDDSQPFGRISYAFSGPKPDPFLDLPSPRPLSSHAGTTGFKNDSQVDESSTKPVRPESGDHLRIYCDASKALALRTWLHNVRVPLASSADSQDVSHVKEVRKTDTVVATDQGEKEIRVLYKTRLVLVGERGEVLIVA